MRGKELLFAAAMMGLAAACRPQAEANSNGNFGGGDPVGVGVVGEPPLFTPTITPDSIAKGVPPTATGTPKLPDATATIAPKENIIPGELNRVYMSNIRPEKSGRIAGKIILEPTREGVVIAYTAIIDTNRGPLRTQNAFVAEPKSLTSRSINFKRPDNTIVDSSMPTGDTKFFGNLTIGATPDSPEQKFTFIAEPFEGNIQTAAAMALNAIEVNALPNDEAVKSLMGTCTRCVSLTQPQ